MHAYKLFRFMWTFPGPMCASRSLPHLHVVAGPPHRMPRGVLLTSATVTARSSSKRRNSNDKRHTTEHAKRSGVADITQHNPYYYTWHLWAGANINTYKLGHRQTLAASGQATCARVRADMLDACPPRGAETARRRPQLDGP